MSNSTTEPGAPSSNSNDATPVPPATPLLETQVPEHSSTAPKPQWQKRLDICLECPDSTDGMMLICKHCGCMMLIKARMPWMKCPVGRW